MPACSIRAPITCLRVVGLSMRDAGILDGDLIAVHKSDTAAHGRIVVARLDDEVTVKELDHRNGRVRLLPANPDFAPIEVDPRRHAFAIEGLYVGLIRSHPHDSTRMSRHVHEYRRSSRFRRRFF